MTLTSPTNGTGHDLDEEQQQQQPGQRRAGQQGQGEAEDLQANANLSRFNGRKQVYPHPQAAAWTLQRRQRRLRRRCRGSFWWLLSNNNWAKWTCHLRAATADLNLNLVRGGAQPARQPVWLGTRKSASATSGLGQGLADMMYGLFSCCCCCCLALPVPVLKSNNNNNNLLPPFSPKMSLVKHVSLPNWKLKLKLKLKLDYSIEAGTKQESKKEAPVISNTLCREGSLAYFISYMDGFLIQKQSINSSLWKLPQLL